MLFSLNEHQVPRKYYIEKHKEPMKYLFDDSFQVPMHD
jgi:hypothetical protein